MKPDYNESEERIRKATEVIWKIWWFSFYLVIVPLITSLIGFYIILAFAREIAIEISILIFISTLLFSYKAYDKYRNKPFFRKEKNNLFARINVLFLITIISLIIPLIFFLITSKDYSNILLPLISFILLYNIVWFYYYYLPIDVFHTQYQKFNHYKTISRLHNIVIVLNYIIHILFLSLVFFTNFSWIFAIITNIIFYFITILYTQGQRSKIKSALKEQRDFKYELIKYQKLFVISIVSLIFVILIQIPIILMVYSLPNIKDSNLMNIIGSALIILFIFIYLKARFYIYFYYESQFKNTNPSKQIEKSTEVFLKKRNKFQKYNSLLTLILISLIILFALIINNIIVILVILPLIYLFSYYERNADYNHKKYNKFVYFLNTIAILATISFGILPSISEVFLLNIQFIVFLISLYFVMEIFVKTKCFTKENVRIFQNILGVISFFIIAYSIYPLIFFEYITFTSDKSLILFLGILMNLIIVLIILLISFYRLYTVIYKKSQKTFKICISVNVFLLELFIFILIIIRAFFLVEINTFFGIVVFSTILFPLLYILFVFINYLVGIFTPKAFLTNCYYACWVLIGSVFVSIFLVSYSFIILIFLDFLLLSILLYYQLKFAQKLEKIKESTFKHFTQINSYFFTGVLFCLFFSVFFLIFESLILGYNIIISAYISLVLICIMVNIIIAENDNFFSKGIATKITIITLLYSCFLPFYFTLIVLWGSYYVYIIPLMLTSLALYLLIFYMIKKEIVPKLMQKILILNSLLLSLTIILIPTIIGLELFRTGAIGKITSSMLFFIYISIFNLTLGILFSILLLTHSISKKFEKLRVVILKSIVILEVIISFTVAFYYPFFFLYGTYYCIIIPVISLSCFLYLPTFYSYEKDFFSSNLIKRIIIINSLVLFFSIILIPTIVGLELAQLGIYVDILLIILATTALIFGFLKFLNYIAVKMKVKENYIVYLKFIQICSWLLISFLLSFEFLLVFLVRPFSSLNIFAVFFILSSFILIFFALNIYNLIQIDKLKDYLTENKDLMLKYLKVYSVFEFFRNLIFYGIIMSLSLFFMALFQFTNILGFLSQENEFLNVFWYLGFFFLFLFIFLTISEHTLRLKFSKLTQTLELISWLYFKVIISLLIAIYAFPFSILNKIALFTLIICLLSPLSLHFFKKAGINLEERQSFIKMVLIYVFLASLLVFYVEIFWFFTFNESIPFLYKNPTILIALIIGNLFLLSNFCFLMLRYILKKESEFQIYHFFGLTGLLFFSLLFFNPIISIFLLFITYFIVLYRRNYNFILRIILYFVLSFITFIEILVLIDTYALLAAVKSVSIGFYVILYLTSIFFVLFLSFLLNLDLNNYFEKISLFSVISTWSFVFIISFTNILLIYNITISLFIFLLFSGINLYSSKDERYKWFIKPCVLLFLFDFTSWISYSFLFLNPDYLLINPILTFTLTASVTGFSFVFLYNKSSEKFRNRSFRIALTSIIFSFPLFIYFFLISYYPIPLEQPIPIIMAMNIGIFLFYLSIGIYQWKLSWAIWRTGWWAWFLLPIINFLIIYNIVTDINVYSNAVNLVSGGDSSPNIDGLIITLIICLLFALPALYTWVKDHFYHILFIVWGVSLFLVFFISFNVFFENLALVYLSFALVAVILLIPILYALKFWRILSKLWLFLAGINIGFLIVFLVWVGIIDIGILISIAILVFGLFVLVYSFFPRIRSQALLITISYFLIITGIFLFVFFLFLSIILNPIISLNIASILLALCLFSSKYLKVNQKVVYFVISVVLIINLSLLTYFTFSLISGLELFAIFLAITVFGGSFFVLNHYKMIKPINKAIPWMTMGLGLGLSISSLFIIFLNVSLLIVGTIFTLIFLLFLYFVLDEYRYLIFYLIPIPLTFLMLDLLLVIEAIQPLIILMWLILYLGFFQIITNIVNLFLKDWRERIKGKGLFNFFKSKNQFRLINFICLIINITCISLLVAIISPFKFTYQVFLFLILWPIFILVSLKLIKTSDLDSKYSNLLTYLNIVSITMYILLPVAITSIILLNLLALEINLIFLVFLLLFIFSGILFVEVFVFDKIILKYLIDPIRKHFTCWSWLVFCNALGIFFYLFHANTFLLILTLALMNIVSNYFLKQLVVKKKERFSKVRLILTYIVLITLAFYIASIISNLIVLYYANLIGMPSTLLFFLNSVLILFTLSYFFNIKIKTNLKIWIEFILFLLIQGLLLAVYYVFIFMILKALNLFTVSLIILIESLLSYISFNYLGKILYKEDEPRSNYNVKISSILTILLYFELSFMAFGVFFDALGFFGSFLISQIVLFILTIVDIYYIKKLNESIGYLIHTVSYVIITTFIFIILYQINPELIYFNLLLLILMQFYTNHAFFSFLVKLKPEKKESLIKSEGKIKCIIGTAFYAIIVVFLQRLISPTPIEFQLLVLSLIVHGLMILDQLYFKFLGKVSKYIKLISWILIMVFSSIYLFWVFNFFLFAFLLSVIPLIIVILVLEVFYLVKLLDFSQRIVKNKEKIKKVLFFILYLDFITWPLYFLGLDLLLNLNLFLFSILLIFGLTFIDKYVRVFNEKFRIFLRKSSFLIIGIVLAVDCFITLDVLYHFMFWLNLSISALIFLIFAAFIIKPFKKHSLLAMAYWNISFLFLSIIVYFIFVSLQISIFFFLITFIIYWFIFALEKLRVLFSKLIDFLATFFKRLKQSIINAVKRIIRFAKKYFTIIWAIVSVFIFLGLLYLFITVLSGILWWLHSFFISLGISLLIFFKVTSKDVSEDPEKVFKRKMIQLIGVWTVVVLVLLNFIIFEFLILFILISLLILGAILLPYIYYKEKKENISIKWRFYGTIFFIVDSIITAIYVYLLLAGIV